MAVRGGLKKPNFHIPQGAEIKECWMPYITANQPAKAANTGLNVLLTEAKALEKWEIFEAPKSDDFPF